MMKKIFAEAGCVCARCHSGDITILEVHHIEPRANGGSNEAENLIAVCPNCHELITKGEVSHFEVFRLKYDILAKGSKPERAENAPPSNVLHFNRSVNTGIVTNQLTLKTGRKSVKISPPDGSIASDLDKRNYLKYLIDRYNKFKRADRNIGEFKYGVIYGAIKTEFKCKWDLIPIHLFPRAVEYMQKRIDNTILGKVQRKQGKGRYRSYDEFLAGLR
ncbi:MAG: HNH endonuclease [Blastocatellia bacterium]